ncbi:hypothetical protein [Paenibacillus polymyxa]|uniref:hypothetical protein n=1 Tax=Paenibacillus polymyxa TaxID=1406 RepID=UPI002AB4C750|nr:hypothetical protein [Paenibacillus polymyxa]MDY8023365.1 hypothetical protein [Paenibacillus polymyxa]
MNNKFYIEREIHAQVSDLLQRLKTGRIKYGRELNEINLIWSRMVSLGKHVFQKQYEDYYLELMKYYSLFLYKEGHYDKSAKLISSIEFFKYTHQLKAPFSIDLENFNSEKVILSIGDYKNLGITLNEVREWANKKKQYKLIQELEFAYNEDGEKEVYFDLYFKDITLNDIEAGKINDMSGKVNWGLY